MDQRANMFALGSLLCEILTGKPAYVGSSADAAEHLRKELLLARAKLDDARQRLATSV